MLYGASVHIVYSGKLDVGDEWKEFIGTLSVWNVTQQKDCECEIVRAKWKIRKVRRIVHLEVLKTAKSGTASHCDMSFRDQG